MNGKSQSAARKVSFIVFSSLSKQRVRGGDDGGGYGPGSANHEPARVKPRVEGCDLVAGLEPTPRSQESDHPSAIGSLQSPSLHAPGCILSDITLRHPSVAHKKAARKGRPMNKSVIVGPKPDQRLAISASELQAATPEADRSTLNADARSLPTRTGRGTPARSASTYAP